MEGIFGVMVWLDHQKAILTAFKLEGEAKKWWKATKKTFGGQEIDITQTFFKREFINKFKPDHIKVQKKGAFETLAQGSKTVAKYALNLTELWHFAEALVATEELKLDRFVDGLREQTLREKCGYMNQPLILQL